MVISENERLRDEVVALADRLGNNRAALIPILQDVKNRHHGIDSFAMQTIADVLGIHPVEVYSTATFYAFLHPEKQGDYVFRLCRTLSCELQGKEAVAEALQEQLGIGFDETTEDGVFTLEWANCMGMCDQGPALLVNDRVYTAVTAETVSQIVQECRSCAVGEADTCAKEYVV
jgi:NADH:ubiquinone oxidoreductase subunit E